jgi:methylated-DNA-[protein]-cysteine S-methyltransferase
VEIRSMSTIAYTTWTAPLGPLVIAASARGLIGAWFDAQKHFAGPDPAWRRDDDHPVLRDAIAQLAGYFAGTRQAFDLPCDPRGTPFQQAVWRAIADVPYGESITYAALAVRAGAPGSARAAGAATGRNPLTIIVPCHRIVGASGGLTGYAGGLARKDALLQLERAAAGRATGTTGDLWRDAVPAGVVATSA